MRAFARLADLVGALARPLAAGAGAVPLTCAGRPWRRLQVGSDGALLGCYGPPRSGQPSVTTSTRLQYGVSLSMRPGANRRDHASGIERRIQV